MIAFEVTHFVRVDTHKIRSRSVSFLEILGLVLNIFNFVGNQFQDLGHEVCSLRVGLTCNFDEIVEDLDDVLADGHEEDREPLVPAVLLLGLEVAEHVVLFADGLGVDQVHQFAQRTSPCLAL